jgi:hypothetical protein
VAGLAGNANPPGSLFITSFLASIPVFKGVRTRGNVGDGMFQEQGGDLGKRAPHAGR